MYNITISKFEILDFDRYPQSPDLFYAEVRSKNYFRFIMYKEYSTPV